MENTEKLNKSGMENLDDKDMETAAGGAHITYLVCCTCGNQVHINGPMINGYYNNNVCPICHGRLKSW